MGYRDDREALRERIDELQRELADTRESHTRRLDELQRSLDALRPADAPKPPRAPITPTPRRPIPPTPNPPGTGVALLAIAGAVLAVGIAAAAVTAQPPRLAPRPPVTKLDADLLPSKIDPTALLKVIAPRVPTGEDLVSIDATYVSDDGTIDRKQPSYGGRVRFEFLAPTPPDPPQTGPLGAPKARAPAAHSSCFELGRDDLAPCQSFVVLLAAPAPRPQCSAREVWEAARAAGAPAGAVAHLKYEHRFMADHPTWMFSIDGTSYNFEISDPDCKVVRNLPAGY